VGPTIGMNILKKKKISFPYWDSNLVSSNPQPTNYSSLRPLNEKLSIIMDNQYCSYVN